MKKITELKANETELISDYKNIVNGSENSVVVKTEWNKKGDFFEKLTIYDSFYIPINAFGGTTLINPL